MTHATLVLSTPDGSWAEQVSTAHPETTFRVLAAVPNEGTGFALVRIVGPDVSATIDDMRAHPQIESMTPVQRTDGEATVHFEVSSPFLFMASRESGIAIELPVSIRDGEATVEAAGSRERLSELVDRLDEFGVGYRVERIGDRVREGQLLSDRQREFVLAAIDRGYYDTPRRCSLTELAGELGVAKSTCSETLHRAEGAIVKRFAAGLPEADGDELTLSGVEPR